MGSLYLISYIHIFLNENDGKSILCKYSDGLIKKWDIIASEILETYHNEDLELLSQKCFIEKKVPSWFSVEKGDSLCYFLMIPNNTFPYDLW